MDLSWPIGSSVNDGIPLKQYLGVDFDLVYPTVDDIAASILHYGPGCLLFKRDLKRAYRQFPVDPGDYHLLGYSWRGQLYFDTVLPMGLHSAAMACQRVTNAVRYICASQGHSVVNYLDDFAGIAHSDIALAAYNFLGDLLRALHLEESEHKAEPPSTNMTILGVRFDTVSMTMSVTAERLLELTALLSEWASFSVASKAQLQSLVGKLAFVSKCVKQSRIFLSRILAVLRSIPYGDSRITVRLSDDFHRDLAWWRRFLPLYNGVSELVDNLFLRFLIRLDNFSAMEGGRLLACSYSAITRPNLNRIILILRRILLAFQYKSTNQSAQLNYVSLKHIMDICVAMDVMNVKAKVLKKTAERIVGKDNLRLAEAIISDGDTIIQLDIWEDNIALIEEGEVNTFSALTVRKWRKNLKLSASRYTVRVR